MTTRSMAWVLVAAGCAAASYAGFRLGAGSVEKQQSSPQPSAGAVVNRAKPAVRAPKTRFMDGPTELARAMREAIEGPDNAAASALRERIEDLGKDEVLVALGELANSPVGPDRWKAIWPFLRRLAQIDPPLALAQAERFTDGTNLISARATILREWAALSPQAALDKARALGREDLHGQFSYLHSVYGAWAEQDFEAVLRTAGTLEDPQEQDVALRALASEAADREDPGAGLFRMAEAFPSPTLQREFVGRAVELWTRRTSLEHVERWLDAQEIEADYQAELRRSLAQGESQRNPGRTADWLLGHSTPDSRAADLRTAVATWAYSHPEACGEWLAGQLSGPEADRAVSVYIDAIANRDPGEALRWVGRIHEDALRRKEYHDVVRAMGPIPDERVRETLHNAGLATELVEDLLERREPW